MKVSTNGEKKSQLFSSTQQFESQSKLLGLILDQF